MNTTSKTKWARLGFLITAPLFLMACSLFSTLSASGSKLSQSGAQATADVQHAAATLAAIPGQVGAAATAINGLGLNLQGTPVVPGTPEPTLQAFKRTPSISLPQSFIYAGMQFNVSKAVITNQVSDADPSVDPSNTYARLSLKIVNQNPKNVIIQDGLFTLTLGDKTTYTQAYIANVAGRDTQDASLEFTVPNTATWSGAQLSFDQNGTVPGVVMLDGSQPTGQYPITLTSGQKLTLKQFRAMTYTIKTATLDLDGLGKRASVGNHYLILGITAYCNYIYNCYVGPEEMRLITDSAPESADSIDIVADSLNYQGSVDFKAAFVIPDTASNLVFEVGEVGKETTQTPIPAK